MQHRGPDDDNKMIQTARVGEYRVPEVRLRCPNTIFLFIFFPHQKTRENRFFFFFYSSKQQPVYNDAYKRTQSQTRVRPYNRISCVLDVLCTYYVVCVQYLK